MAEPAPDGAGEPVPRDPVEGAVPEAAGASLDLFLAEHPTRDLQHWAWLWTGDRPFPVTGRPGLLGRLVVGLKRLLRPFVKAPAQDLWERQRVFNLILLENLVREREARLALHRHVDQSQTGFQAAIEAHARRLEQFDVRIAEGMSDVMGHNDALFARVDQKLDRYRREAKELWHRLGALIAAAQAVSPPRSPQGDEAADEASADLSALAAAQRDQSYVELERRHRGSEEEIAGRVAVYLPYLERCRDLGPVLDLGCGRGEALAVFSQHGFPVRGLDSNREMVDHCRKRGLEVEAGELFEKLAAVDGTLGAVVSFHVIEHLPPESLERLMRLAWKALAPGGALVLETPSPLSVVVAARDFWIDPTHRRPVHPATLELGFREAGFEPVHRLDLQPFPDSERLPEIDLAVVPEGQRLLADQVNRLRDLLDDLLFGCRDFGMVGYKP